MVYLFIYFFVSGSSDLFESKIFVSSAKRYDLEVSMDLFKSFIYNRKRRGPRTEPCGKPV